jgi:hypothetical protein
VVNYIISQESKEWLLARYVHDYDDDMFHVSASLGIGGGEIDIAVLNSSGRLFYFPGLIISTTATVSN